MRDATLNVAVIGLGLIGGSVLRALALHGHRVSGYDADPATRATARTAAAQAPANARWHVTASIGDAVRDADLTVVAVPLPAVGAVFDELASLGYVGVVTDVTSVKGPVRDLAADRLRTGGQALATFVGGHPMAGRETSGFTAADPRLFTGCAWVLCLSEDGTGIRDWVELAALITGLGARVVPATADEHDAAVAAISHVPHLVAAAVAALISNDPLAGTLGAGSFRDGTRVAAARPQLTAAMCGGNAPAVRRALDTVLADLNVARAALDDADPIGALTPWLTPGYNARLAWPPQPGESADLPARVDVLLRLGRVGGWIESVSADRRTVRAIRPA
ncbi:prephenate dehydrogenase/arogenate dehydrogenase family protein [Dactylosporangium sp. NPDC051484]|uniref:prephenate dehydrogenase/arogenate dehydrogenase family protein n=1 Tax=Dactylosporangium sp. NPDC051484 TaxID=3154942 RepID=UPI00344C156D